ncbi:MAG: DUF481 domain-containing protein [Gammaproteobacteria bacterium]
MFRSVLIAVSGPRSLLLTVTLLLSTSAVADILFLTDGSRLVGALQENTADGYVIETSYAGKLVISASAVAGVSSDAPLTVALDSKERVVGRLDFDPETSTQRVRETAFGDVNIEVTRIAAFWKNGERSPTIQKLEERIAAYEDPWSGRVTFGFQGASGNTDRRLIKGRAEARREVDKDRLLLYVEGHSEEQNKQLTESEIRLGMNMERNFAERWFAFLDEDLEHDKFENLQLRSNTNAGVGYFAIKKPQHEWKLRAGIGYEYASFDNGTDQRRAIAVLGYDYRIDIADWVRFTHQIRYLPSLEDPAKDYRVRSDVGLEVPLASSELFAIRVGLRNEYNNTPPASAKSLDTTYGAELVVKVP